MLNQMSVELLARDVVQRRIAEAEMAALAAQLPRHAPLQPTSVARHAVAASLRGLAARLDPSIAHEPGLAVANSR